MSRLSRFLEIATNSAVLVLCLLIGSVLIRNWLVAPPSSQSSRQIVIGSKLDITGVAWASEPKTIVLGLSTQCHFCSESTPFYARLMKAASEKHRRTIAVFPQNADESSKYLSSKQLQFDKVVSAPLDSIHVNGTPTLLIVDSSGKIRSAWVGKLQRQSEDEILASL